MAIRIKTKITGTLLVCILMIQPVHCIADEDAWVSWRTVQTAVAMTAVAVVSMATFETIYEYGDRFIKWCTDHSDETTEAQPEEITVPVNSSASVSASSNHSKLINSTAPPVEIKPVSGNYSSSSNTPSFTSKIDRTESSQPQSTPATLPENDKSTTSHTSETTKITPTTTASRTSKSSQTPTPTPSSTRSSTSSTSISTETTESSSTTTSRTPTSTGSIQTSTLKSSQAPTPTTSPTRSSTSSTSTSTGTTESSTIPSRTTPPTGSTQTSKSKSSLTPTPTPSSTLPTSTPVESKQSTNNSSGTIEPSPTTPDITSTSTHSTQKPTLSSTPSSTPSKKREAKQKNTHEQPCCSKSDNPESELKRFHKMLSEPEPSKEPPDHGKRPDEKTKPESRRRKRRKKTIIQQTSSAPDPKKEYEQALKEYLHRPKETSDNKPPKRKDNRESGQKLIGPRLENGDFYSSDDINNNSPDSPEPPATQTPDDHRTGSEQDEHYQPEAPPESEHKKEEPTFQSSAKNVPPEKNDDSVVKEDLKKDVKEELIVTPPEQDETSEPIGRKDALEKVEENRQETPDPEPKQEPIEAFPVVEKVRPQAEPFIGESEQAVMTAAASINLVTGVLSLESLAGVRGIMRLYRTGRMFEYGTVSLDEIIASELMASAEHTELSDWPVKDLRHQGWHSFVQVYGVEGHRKQTRGLQGSTYKGFGLNTGVFSELSDHLILGILFGVQDVSGRFLNSKGSGSVVSVRLGPFLSWYRDNWHLDMAFTVARNEFELDRHADNGSSYQSRFNGMEWSVYSALGYDIPMHEQLSGLTISPVLEVFYTQAKQSGYKEKGYKEKDSGSQPLQVRQQSSSQWLTRTGLEMEYLMPDLQKPTYWHFALGWQHQNLTNKSVSYEMPTANASGVFKIPVFNDSGLFFGIGYTRRQSENASINIRYHGLLTRHTQGHGLQLEYEVKF